MFFYLALEYHTLETPSPWHVKETLMLQITIA